MEANETSEKEMPAIAIFYLGLFCTTLLYFFASGWGWSLAATLFGSFLFHRKSDAEIAREAAERNEDNFQAWLNDSPHRRTKTGDDFIDGALKVVVVFPLTIFFIYKVIEINI